MFKNVHAYVICVLDVNKEVPCNENTCTGFVNYKAILTSQATVVASCAILQFLFSLYGIKLNPINQSINQSISFCFNPWREVYFSYLKNSDELRYRLIVPARFSRYIGIPFPTRARFSWYNAVPLYTRARFSWYIAVPLYTRARFSWYIAFPLYTRARFNWYNAVPLYTRVRFSRYIAVPFLTRARFSWSFAASIHFPTLSVNY